MDWSYVPPIPTNVNLGEYSVNFVEPIALNLRM
jgi:hypothetical protein